MTLHILIFLIIMPYFVKAGQYELADYMKKHEIVNKIKYGITRAFITVSTCADKWSTSYELKWLLISLFFA